MARTRWNRQIGERPRPGPRPRPRWRPRIDVLEDRVVPAVTWDGGGVINNWSDRFNCGVGVAPGNDHASCVRDRNVGSVDPGSLSSTNNTVGLSVTSITINDSGYPLGGTNAVTLGAGGITFDDASSPTQSVVNLPLVVT